MSKRSKFLAPEKLEEGAQELAALAKQEGATAALVGGFLLQLHGSPRLTADIDFISDTELQSLQAQRRLSFGGVAAEAPETRVPVDWIVRDDDVAILYTEALEHSYKDEELGIYVVPLEYVGAMKFYAGRRRDLDDLAFLLSLEEFDREEATRIIREHLGRYAVKEFNAFVAESDWEASRLT